jgi:hypothetical protein
LIVDAIAQVVAWMTDATTGVNAIRTTVPGEASTAIPSVTWYDSNTHAWAARGTIERDQMTTAWIGVVSRLGDVALSAQPQHHRPSPPVPVLIRFAARDTATHTEVKIGEQLVRCATRAIAAVWWSNNLADVTRNGVLFEPPTLRALDIWQQPGDDAVVGALLVSLPALDAWALGRST